tara:strand:+ start:175 stop:549 length:375 start_codon:yes stop_codon:yes gene_type:complete
LVDIIKENDNALLLMKNSFFGESGLFSKKIGDKILVSPIYIDIDKEQYSIKEQKNSINISLDNENCILFSFVSDNDNIEVNICYDNKWTLKSDYPGWQKMNGFKDNVIEKLEVFVSGANPELKQ